MASQCVSREVKDKQPVVDEKTGHGMDEKTGIVSLSRPVFPFLPLT